MSDLVFAGELMLPHALSLGASLANKWGLKRWRCQRLVAKRTGIDFPTRQYRIWLRGLNPSTWEESVETAAPLLAESLDAALSDAGWPWTRMPYRLSTALKIVTATYAALMELEGGPQARVLIESWSKRRNDRLLDALNVVALRSARVLDLDPTHATLRLLRESTARKQVRLAALVADPVMQIRVRAVVGSRAPDVPVGTCLFLEGPFGAGKSEAAEDWFRDQVSRYEQVPGSPFPVWLDASAIAEGSIRTSLAAQVGAQAVAGTSSVAVVVDGLDELAPERAIHLVADLVSFAGGNVAGTVLVTTREGVIEDHFERQQVQPLSGHETDALLDLYGVHQFVTHNWPKALLEAAERPFFAIAIAEALSNGRVLNGTASIVSYVVERCLSRATEAKMVRSSDSMGLLTSLAEKLTDSDTAPKLSVGERANLLTTRLVAERESDMVFALPIFQQWFASRALVANVDRAARAVADGRRFGRWRWALSVAAIDLGVEDFDRLLRSIFQTNPGAGLWLLSELERSVPTTAFEDSSWEVMGRRLVRVVRTVAESLGPAGLFMLPLEPEERFDLGLRSEGDHLEIGWRTSTGIEDEYHELGPGVFAELIGGDASDLSYHTFASMRSAPDVTWPWNHVRTVMNRRLQELFKSYLGEN